MSLADEEVAKLYGFDEILGGAPKTAYAEKGVKFLKNPYSLNDDISQNMNVSMVIQSGGRRRSRRANRKRKATKRRGRRHH